MTRKPLDPPPDFICGSAALMSRTRFTAAERKATSDARAQWIIDRYREGYPRKEIASALKFANAETMFKALNGRPMPYAMRPDPNPKRAAQRYNLKLGKLEDALLDNLASGDEIRRLGKQVLEGGYDSLAHMVVATLLSQLRDE